MKKALHLTVCSIFMIASASGQDLTFYGLIPSLSQTGLISKKLDYNFFASMTNNAFGRTISDVYYPASLLQVYIQPSIIYKISPSFNVAASITCNYQKSNPNATWFSEWRLWQQIVYSHNPFRYKGRLSHRVRLEERFIKNPGDIYRNSIRLRYQIGCMVPLQGKTLDAGELYFNTYYEFYFTLSNPKDRPRNALHSEDWIYAGIGYHTGKTGRVELGPLYQTNVRDRQHDRRNLLLLQLLWATTFNPLKK